MNMLIELTLKKIGLTVNILNETKLKKLHEHFTRGQGSIRGSYLVTIE